MASFSQKLHLPTRLTLGLLFNQSLDRVTLPSSLRSLTFGRDFNHSLENVQFPSNLRSITFGTGFKQSLEPVLLSQLESLTLSGSFSHNLQGLQVTQLHHLSLGNKQNLLGLTFPSTLRSLVIGGWTPELSFPALQSLTFGNFFDQTLEKIPLPGVS